MKNDKYVDFGGKIEECKCGKRFIPTADWVYKISGGKGKRTKYYCSYTCWRKDGGGNGKDTRYAGKTIK